MTCLEARGNIRISPSDRQKCIFPRFRITLHFIWLPKAKHYPNSRMQCSLYFKNIKDATPQNFHVHSLFRLILEHSPNFAWSTMIISFPVSPKAPFKYIAIYIDHSLFTACPQYNNSHNQSFNHKYSPADFPYSRGIHFVP